MRQMKIDRENDKLVYDYMKAYEGVIPYMFPTTYEQFTKALWEDKLQGHPVLREQYVSIYMDDEDKVRGVVQYGLSGVHYTEKGERLVDPEIGNIRHLYYDVACQEVGASLLEEALGYFKDEGIEEVFAFDHVAGMSCYSRHGKLHESMNHVKKLLIEYGILVHHENVYYTWDLEQVEESTPGVLLLAEEGDERMMLTLVKEENQEEIIGYGEATDLSLWGTQQNVYLRYITIQEAYRGMGYSKAFLHAIGARYKASGCRYLHTDTSLYNGVAQALYEKLGMKRCGVTYDFNDNKAVNCCQRIRR